MNSQNRSGVLIGAAAYAVWGLFPIYWKWLDAVPATQIIAHRILWSFLLLGSVIMPGALRRARTTGAMGIAIGSGTVALYAAAAALIAINWFIYVWAVNHEYILETSLGYFVTPLVNVLLGVLLLRERLRPGQWAAVAIAAAGVAYLTFVYGQLPWIAMALAATFGTYGLVKKKAPYGSVVGLTLETGILVLPAIAYLALEDIRGSGAFLHTDMRTNLLIAGCGVVTTIPLLMFATAVQRVPLSVIGLLQYIAPSIQFVLGVLVYHEPFNRQQLVGFALVWSALAVYAGEGIARAQRPIAVLDEGEF